MSNIRYDFKIGKSRRQRFRVLAAAVRALWTGSFVVETADLQPNVEPLGFSEANYKEVLRQRKKFADENSRLQRLLSNRGSTRTRTMTEDESRDFNGAFAEMDKTFAAMDRVFEKSYNVFNGSGKESK
jgi:hypothetical protein